MIPFSPEDYCIRNEDTINALKKDVGGEVAAMLLGVFIDETQALYEQIPDSLNAQNALEVTRLLHSMIPINGPLFRKEFDCLGRDIIHVSAMLRDRHVGNR